MYDMARMIYDHTVRKRFNEAKRWFLVDCQTINLKIPGILYFLE